MGGVYSSLNLSLYTYGHQNPVKYLDPDGNFTILEGLVAVAFVIVAGVAISNYMQNQKRSPNGSDPLLNESGESGRNNKAPLLPKISPIENTGSPQGPGDPNGDSNLKSDRSRPTDRYKESLDDRHLDAARRELKGEVVRVNPRTGKPYDHVTEVRSAQQGLQNRIEQIKRQLGSPSSRLSEAQRADLTRELGDASRLLDYSKQFVPPAEP
jgi:hypothetical protein